MRAASLTLSLITTASVVSSLLVPPNLVGLIGGFNFELNSVNHYGAPIPPWNSGAKPGWCCGNLCEELVEDVFYLSPYVCKILGTIHLGFLCPQPLPVPYNGYKQTFSNLTGATQAADYMTFGLVNTVADCLSMCNNVQGCGFANSYHDVNGKGGSTMLTCSLYTSCHNSSDATNLGGQSQPDGSIDYITNSDGWCKVV